MITVEEAKNLIRDKVPGMNAGLLPVAECCGCVLAEDVYSLVNIPPFNQSSMDGFAVRFADDSKNEFHLKGEIPAGSPGNIELHKGEAYRIFTGAPVPKNADAIVIQEDALVCNDVLSCPRPIKSGAFIRREGAQTKSGDLVLRAGTILTPAAIGYLASCGIAAVRAIRKPEIVVIITGNEITTPGNPLPDGHVYDSNSYALQSALAQIGVPVRSVQFVRDDQQEVQHAISGALAQADLVLISGGISVGKYDFVSEAMDRCGIEKIFYKVAQKPGKPLFAGRCKGKTVFALPGNPASVLVCFYEYVVPALRSMMNYPFHIRKAVQRKLSSKIVNNDNRLAFVRAKQDGINVTSLEDQESYMLKSFAAADSFILVPPHATLKKGEMAEVHLIPVTL